jgi:hypothetical protein
LPFFNKQHHQNCKGTFVEKAAKKNLAAPLLSYAADISAIMQLCPPPTSNSASLYLFLTGPLLPPQQACAVEHIHKLHFSAFKYFLKYFFSLEKIGSVFQRKCSSFFI